MSWSHLALWRVASMARSNKEEREREKKWIIIRKNLNWRFNCTPSLCPKSELYVTDPRVSNGEVNKVKSCRRSSTNRWCGSIPRTRYPTLSPMRCKTGPPVGNARAKSVTTETSSIEYGVVPNSVSYCLQFHCQSALSDTHTKTQLNVLLLVFLSIVLRIETHLVEVAQWSR